MNFKSMSKKLLTLLLSVFIFSVSFFSLSTNMVLAQESGLYVNNSNAYAVEVTPFTKTRRLPKNSQTETINVQCQIPTNSSNDGPIFGIPPVEGSSCPTGSTWCCEGNVNPPPCFCCVVIEAPTPPE